MPTDLREGASPKGWSQTNQSLNLSRWHNLNTLWEPAAATSKPRKHMRKRLLSLTDQWLLAELGCSPDA